MVKVFFSDISKLDENIDYMEFCDKRKEYVKSISCAKRKKQSVYAWKLLLYALDSLNISYDGFYVQNNKWSLVNSSYKFSISHSNNLVVVAISEENVGVDVEMCSAKLLKVAKRMFPNQKTPKNKLDICFYGELWVERECQIKSGNASQAFYSVTISDDVNNKYILGVVCDSKFSLEKISLV